MFEHLTGRFPCGLTYSGLPCQLLLSLSDLAPRQSYSNSNKCRRGTPKVWAGIYGSRRGVSLSPSNNSSVGQQTSLSTGGPLPCKGANPDAGRAHDIYAGHLE